jgi:CheY-like chemotaxis protein
MKGRILVADDDPVAVEALSSMLKAAGYAVTVAQDAMQALMRAVKDAPDGIVLDIGMPGGGGERVLERLKASSKTNTIPVVVVTALTNVHSRAKALGATEVLAKPVTAQELLHALDRALEGPPSPTEDTPRRA